MQTINSNTCNHLIVCKQISSVSFKNVTNKLFAYKSYRIYAYTGFDKGYAIKYNQSTNLIFFVSVNYDFMGK